jgi:hypothetical protein
VVTVALAVRSRHRVRTQLAVVAGLGALVLSFGHHLTWYGHVTGIPLPELLIAKLPFLDNILPARIGLETDAAIAAIVAFGLDDLRTGLTARRATAAPIEEVVAARPGTGLSGRSHIAPPSGGRDRLEGGRPRPAVAVVATLVVLALLVATQLPRWPYPARRVTSVPAAVIDAVPAGDPVALTYPYPVQSAVAPMIWQIRSGYRFELLGGYALTRNAGGTAASVPLPMHPPQLQEFLAAQEGIGIYGPVLPVTASLVATAKATLAAYQVRLLIVDRSQSGSGPVVDLFTQALGPPSRQAGTFSAWATAGPYLGAAG